MRISIKYFYAFAASICLVPSLPAAPSENDKLLEKGMEFYARGQYDSAKELLKNIPDDSSAKAGSVAYYLGSIAANEGDKSAYARFVRAMETAPDNLKKMAAVQFARFALVNGDFSEADKSLSKAALADGADSLLAWYYAKILFAQGKIGQAKALLEKMLAADFSATDSGGADEFVSARVEGDDFAKIADLTKLPFDTPAARARLDFIAGRAVSENFDSLPLVCMVAHATGESDGKGEISEAERSALKRKISENQILSFVWRGAYALAKLSFKDKDWKLCAAFCTDALVLAPPDFALHIPLIMLKGDALRMQKKYDAARAQYLEIAMSKNRAALGEPSAEALYKTGLCWYEQGDWATAHAYFERVFIAYFKFEYWGARAYYYDARALWSLGSRRDANATLVEYFRRAKIKDSQIYKEAKDFYDKI